MQPIIEEDEVKELKDFVKHRFRDIAETYLRCADEYVDVILEGHKNEDAQAMMEAAHPLKSSSGNLGLRALSDLSRKIEETASNVMEGEAEFSELAPLVADLKDVHDKSNEALREHI
ncbi:MAG: Hpt domain-containing protein [Alphaproteobacteria bacterium]|nr:Hpt domain-containing protein [Alphaproteobacteria bacterium]